MDSYGKKKKPAGIGLLIGIGPKPKGGMDEDGDMPDSEDPATDDDTNVKLTTAEAMISAFHASDAEALVEALDAYKKL